MAAQSNRRGPRIHCHRRALPVFIECFCTYMGRHTICDSPRARKSLDARPRSRREGKDAMKLGFRQGLASAAIFGAVLLMLVSIDDRVRDRFTELLSRGNSLSPWGDRAGDLGDA